MTHPGPLIQPTATHQQHGSFSFLEQGRWCWPHRDSPSCNPPASCSLLRWDSHPEGRSHPVRPVPPDDSGPGRESPSLKGPFLRVMLARAPCPLKRVDRPQLNPSLSAPTHRPLRLRLGACLLCTEVGCPPSPGWKQTPVLRDVTSWMEVGLPPRSLVGDRGQAGTSAGCNVSAFFQEDGIRERGDTELGCRQNAIHH